jgi:hypothetical protein
MNTTGRNVRVTGEPWFDCAICGFSFPYAERMRHYKSGLLVDRRCMDEPTHHDYLGEWNPFETEYEHISEQPVAGQGPAVWVGDTLAWNGQLSRAWRKSKWKHGSQHG